MIIDIIFVHLHMGSDIWGCQYGPSCLKRNGIQEWFRKEGHTINRVIDIFEDISLCRGDNKLLINEKAVFDINDKLYKEVRESIGKGHLPLVVGGDHSLGIGSVAASLSVFQEEKVIWVDAHADMNTPDTSSSHRIHGMPLAFLMKNDCFPKESVNFTVPYLKPSNILLIGTRSVDLGEQELIENESIQFISSKEIKCEYRKAKNLITSIISGKDCNFIHLSIDIDVLDPSCAPGTGVPVDSGIDIDSLLGILSIIIESGKVICIDLVEFNPLIEEHHTKETIFNLLKHIMTTLKI